MTAVIGILNKNAIAIAADSAVTVSGNNGRKIYNTANKIFMLSKYHPVSIIIYNSANFLSTPWEIIIKIYRDKLKDKSFSCLKDYSEDFFNFLKGEKFFTSEETINHYIQSFIYFSFEDLSKMAINQAIENENQDGLISMTSDKRIKLFRKNIVEILEHQITELRSQEKLKDFKSLTRKRFDEISKKVINEILKSEFSEYNTKKIKELFSDLTYEYIRSKVFFGPWTGLVFAGYGDNDIYPTAISTRVADVYDNKVRFYTERIEKIDEGNTGSIMPFAQRDVIDTIIAGMSPEINETLFTTFNNFLNGYNDFLIKLIDNKNPELTKSLKNLDTNSICKEFVDEIEGVMKIKHIEPTVSTVSILSKEDLAEMAESLIYLTYLKRRISSDEESVGGPVDVALISKGDGFIWIKRKHYFEKEFNHHFTKNYYTH